MQFVLFLVFAACSFTGYTRPDESVTLNELRLSYRDATTSKEAAQIFYDKVSTVSVSDAALMTAYKGAGLMLVARYTKLNERGSKVKEAASWIEKAVAREPDNIEIRWIRLSIQQHLPKIARYNQNIEEDLAFIQKKKSSLNDPELKQAIDSYFKTFSK